MGLTNEPMGEGWNPDTNLKSQVWNAQSQLELLSAAGCSTGCARVSKSAAGARILAVPPTLHERDAIAERNPFLHSET
jgi:hypothetical protein